MSKSTSKKHSGSEPTAAKSDDLIFAPGYRNEAPSEIRDLARNLISDWDGTNWEALEMYIGTHARSITPETLKGWTLHRLRMWLATGFVEHRKRTGGTYETTTGTFTPIQVGEISVECPIESPLSKNEPGLLRLFLNMQSKANKRVDYNEVIDEYIARSNKAINRNRRKLYNLLRNHVHKHWIAPDHWE
jgi:hypothetical protein